MEINLEYGELVSEDLNIKIYKKGMFYNCICKSCGHRVKSPYWVYFIEKPCKENNYARDCGCKDLSSVKNQNKAQKVNTTSYGGIIPI